MMEQGMQGRGGHATLEELLSAVEGDESLRSAESTSSGEQNEGQGGALDGLGLGELLARPELISKLPTLLKIAQTLTAPSPPISDKRPETPEALLCALRPYLGEGRRQVLDVMIRISKLSKTLKSL
jgi:hypothetical protein